MIHQERVEDLLKTKEQLIKYLGQLESKNIPKFARRVLLFDIPNLAERLGYIIEHIQESVDILCNDKQSKERLYKHFAQFMQELLSVGLITNVKKKPSVFERFCDLIHPNRFRTVLLPSSKDKRFLRNC